MSKDFWEQYTKHLFTKKYSVNNIIHSISSIEREFLNDLDDKRVLHPFCNFGMNTFSLEQMGADVVGLDYNPHAIDIANRYKENIKSKSIFLCGDFFEYETDNLYDIVYASFGVLDWVEDIELFLNKINSLLKTDGKFIMVEYHSDFFIEKLSELGTRISDSTYEIKTGFKKVIGTSASSLMGNGYDTKEDVIAKPQLHNTNEFLKSVQDMGFIIDKIEYFDYISWKMGNDIKIGSQKYRNKNLKEGDKMAFGIITSKK